MCNFAIATKKVLKKVEDFFFLSPFSKYYDKVNWIAASPESQYQKGYDGDVHLMGYIKFGVNDEEFVHKVAYFYILSNSTSSSASFFPNPDISQGKKTIKNLDLTSR